MAQQDYLDLMAQRVQDTDERLTPDDFLRALRAAVVRFSKDRPACNVIDLEGNGFVQMPLPAGFDPELSRINSIEYPIGDNPPAMMATEAYSVRQTPTGWYLFVDTPLYAPDALRANWTGQHTVDATTDTIHAMYLDAVCDWAAHLLAHDLATLYSGDSDPTINADSVDHNGKSRAFASRSKTLAERYWNALGIQPKRNAAAGVVVDMDTTGFQGRARLQHHRRHH